MTQTPQRPSVARKHTRSTEQNRKAALEGGVRITVDGTEYVVRMGDVTPEIVRDLRRNLGCGFQGLCQMLAADPDVDVVSAFVWVARRCEGESVEFGDVAVSYAQMLGDGFDVEQVDDAEGDDSPEG